MREALRWSHFPRRNKEHEVGRRFRSVRPFMLSVGREIHLSEQQVVCLSCLWEGTGKQLTTGLTEMVYPEIFLFAYRCPECGCFDTARKGKLEFNSRHVAQSPDASDKGCQLEISPAHSKECTTNGNRRV